MVADETAISEPPVVRRIWRYDRLMGLAQSENHLPVGVGPLTGHFLSMSSWRRPAETHKIKICKKSLLREEKA